jgi:hypothetical protein
MWRKGLNEFGDFKMLHDEEIKGFLNCDDKLISSMGI